MIGVAYIIISSLNLRNCLRPKPRKIGRLKLLSTDIKKHIKKGFFEYVMRKYEARGWLLRTKCHIFCSSGCLEIGTSFGYSVHLITDDML